MIHIQTTGLTIVDVAIATLILTGFILAFVWAWGGTETTRKERAQQRKMAALTEMTKSQQADLEWLRIMAAQPTMPAQRSDDSDW